MKETVKAIIFDVDGVLINCVDHEGRFLWQKDIEKDLGISIQQTSTLFQKYWPLIGTGRLDTLEAIRQFLSSINSNLKPEEFMSYWHTKDSNINDDTLKMAKKLKSLGYQLYIGTNQESYRAAHIRKLLNQENTFNEVFPSCDIGFEKPNKEYFSSVQNKIALSPSEILFIDDSFKNVESAKSIGWFSYHFKNYEQAERELFNQLIV